MKPCPSCGHPVALRIGLKIRCGNPACRRYDERLAGADAGRPWIADPKDREGLARHLTPPGWVRWLSGLLFLLPVIPAVYGFRAAEGPDRWWALLPGLPFAVIGVLILFSAGGGRAFATESKGAAKLRQDRNMGCGFGLIMGIAAFTVASLVGVPLILWFRRDFFGLPPPVLPLAALLVVGALATLWGNRRARRRRRETPDA